MAIKVGSIFIVCIFSILQITRCCTPAEQIRCKLPYCLCPSLEIPGQLTTAETPQIVYLTFDDAVSTINYDFYESLLFHRTNPNGAPISATFFITHEYNNYTMIHDLFRKGHEIALHSITHNTGTDYWKTMNESMWEYEGFRAPFLQTGGDKMMSVLYDEGVEYDCSRPTWRYMEPGLWPYTADYDMTFQDCQIQPCSVRSYPGFWIVPMVDYIGDNGSPCAMVDNCLPVPQTSLETYNLFKRNFERNYNGNRAPFGIFTHAAWLSEIDEPGRERLKGYKLFLDYLESKDDVYMLSVAKGLEWVKRPTKLENLDTFLPWQNNGELPNNCPQRYQRPCHFSPENTPFPGERYMPSCQACPRKYPWIKNPYGLL